METINLPNLVHVSGNKERFADSNVTVQSAVNLLIRNGENAFALLNSAERQKQGFERIRLSEEQKTLVRYRAYVQEGSVGRAEAVRHGLLNTYEPS